MAIRDDNNKELAEALTVGDGPLGEGARPAVEAANEKAFLESLQPGAEAAESKQKGNRRKNPPKGETEEVEPKTFEEFHPYLFRNNSFQHITSSAFVSPMIEEKSSYMPTLPST